MLAKKPDALASPWTREASYHKISTTIRPQELMGANQGMLFK